MEELEINNQSNSNAGEQNRGVQLEDTNDDNFTLWKSRWIEIAKEIGLITISLHGWSIGRVRWT